MQLRWIQIENFKRIEKLDWKPKSDMVCVIGSGDVGKSSLLDAIEAVLSPKKSQFFDTDFINCDISKTIKITLTIGELSDDLLDENRFGLYLRGWSLSLNEIHDEPLDGDESVVSVRLIVDKSLIPVWELITDRETTKSVVQKDKISFGLVRLTDETESFAWGKYSRLASLSEDKIEAGSALVDAYRKSHDLIKSNPLSDLIDAAKKARLAAIEMGAYSTKDFLPGLDMQGSSTNLKNLSLHSNDIPIRLAGLGTRRLTALAIQRLSIPEGAIVLVDEIENGLEPHRIRHVLKVLRNQTEKKEKSPVGQVLITTHSPVAVEELTTQELAIASQDRQELKLCIPDHSLQSLIRKNSQALLSKSIVVCEGRTEIGLLRALRDWWSERNNNEPVEFRGVVFTSGDGSSGPTISINLNQLGYRVALFRDSDCELNDSDALKLSSLGVDVYEWDKRVSTEEVLFNELSDSSIQKMLNIAIQEKGEDSVKKLICNSFGIQDISINEFENWIIPEKPPKEIKQTLGTIAKKNGWFKRIDLGEKLGDILYEELSAKLNSSSTVTLQKLERWMYGN